jgi:hypothetical protein
MVNFSLSAPLSRGIAPLILKFCSRWRCAAGQPQYPVSRGLGWSPETIWTFWMREMSPAPVDIRTLDSPARNLVANRMRHSGSFSITVQIKNSHTLSLYRSYVFSTLYWVQFSLKNGPSYERMCDVIGLTQKQTKLKLNACSVIEIY